MTAEEKSRLIAAIAVSLKIRLDEDDPAFVVVELNRLILEQTIRSAIRQIQGVRPSPQAKCEAPAAAEIARLVAGELGARSTQQANASGSATIWFRVTALSTALAVLILAYLLGRSGIPLFP
jgi:hypothetical protein